MLIGIPLKFDHKVKPCLIKTTKRSFLNSRVYWDTLYRTRIKNMGLCIKLKICLSFFAKSIKVLIIGQQLRREPSDSFILIFLGRHYNIMILG